MPCHLYWALLGYLIGHTDISTWSSYLGSSSGLSSRSLAADNYQSEMCPLSKTEWTTCVTPLGACLQLPRIYSFTTVELILRGSLFTDAIWMLAIHAFSNAHDVAMSWYCRCWYSCLAFTNAYILIDARTCLIFCFTVGKITTESHHQLMTAAKVMLFGKYNLDLDHFEYLKLMVPSDCGNCWG